MVFGFPDMRASEMFLVIAVEIEERRMCDHCQWQGVRIKSELGIYFAQKWQNTILRKHNLCDKDLYTTSVSISAGPGPCSCVLYNTCKVGSEIENLAT